MFSEVPGNLNALINIGDTFKKGVVIAELDSSHEQRMLTLLNSSREATLRQLALKQRQLKDYEIVSALGSLSQEEKDDKLDELLLTRIQLNQLELGIEQLKYVLNQKQFTAPFDGIVTGRFSNPAQTIAANTPILEIVDPKSMHVIVKIPAGKLSQLDYQNGMSLIWQGSKIPLVLDYVNQKIEPSTNTLELSYELPVLPIKLGQSVVLEINKKTPELQISDM